MTVSSLPFLRRLWLSWLFAWRILSDGTLAARAARLLASDVEPEPELPAKAPPAPAAIAPVDEASARANGALQLLSLLQREGRFVDFVEQDVTAFDDADIGAAARVVHDGCQRALRSHARIQSVRDEAEGQRVTIAQASEDLKLVGKVAGSAPFNGVLRHRGWRVAGLKLPTVVGAPDLSVVAPAELELQ